MNVIGLRLNGFSLLMRSPQRASTLPKVTSAIAATLHGGVLR